MAIPIRSPDEIRKLDAAARVCWSILDETASACKPGITTRELDEIARIRLADSGATPLFDGYRVKHGPPFRGVCCISVQEEALHGVPGTRELRDGDLLTIDCGLSLEGWCADSAVSVQVGEPTPVGQRLRVTTRAVLDAAARSLQCGRRWSSVAEDLSKLIETAGFDQAIGYSGHGIGRDMHEVPRVTIGEPHENIEEFQLRPGMVFTIEPTLCERGAELNTLDDGWTVATIDGRLVCHEEWMFAITREGPIVLGKSPISVAEPSQNRSEDENSEDRAMTNASSGLSS